MGRLPGGLDKINFYPNSHKINKALQKKSRTISVFHSHHMQAKSSLNNRPATTKLSRSPDPDRRCRARNCRDTRDQIFNLCKLIEKA